MNLTLHTFGCACVCEREKGLKGETIFGKGNYSWKGTYDNTVFL